MIVTLTGSGFGSTASLMRVDFGGTPATIVTISDTTIVVSTPRRTLASPNVPETVDVTVTDFGSPVQRCARVVSGFVYTALALDPVIYSVSPRTGPNDATTRVSIFGTGFQFPMQVFLTGGTCGAQRVEAAVSDISLNTIVFKTPVAVGGNVCLSNQLVDIVILNPSTGKTATCPACFKYYSCPTITSIGPGFGSYLGGTQVIITGHNFEEPAAVDGGGTAWSTISVSSQQIIAVTPPAILTGACADISKAVHVIGTSLSSNCPNPDGPIFTYYVKSLSPFITGFSPSSVAQGGGAVTITGGNFFSNSMRVKVNTAPAQTVFATATSPTQLTFIAPAFSGTFTQAPCTVGGVAGTQNAPTLVDVNVLNAVTTCPSAIDQLTYIPADQTCRPTAALAIAATLANGTTGTPYSGIITATGGVPPYSFAVTVGALPPGLALSAGGLISGTPTVAGTFNFSVRVTDSATPTAQTATTTLSITVSTPAPLAIAANLPNGTTGTAYNAIITATGGTPGYTFAVVLGSLPNGLNLSAGGFISGTPTVAGTFNFSAMVTDSGTPTAQTATVPLSITVNPPAPLAIATTALPNGTLTPATPYIFTFVATGGTPGYTWSITSGFLPPGLTLNGATGTISGTPTTAGIFNFAIRVADSASPTATATAAVSITITP
jgi:hypothetical protein